MPTHFNLYLWIALGGALGSMARFGATEFALRHFSGPFPWGTLAVNVAGSLVIGFFATLVAPAGRFSVGNNGRHFFMTGVLGGFTTFSSFSLQTLVLASEGDWLRAGGNVASSMILCLLAVWLGHLAALALGALLGVRA